LLCKSVGICGLTEALAELLEVETSEIATIGEEVLVEALGMDFLDQFTTV